MNAEDQLAMNPVVKLTRMSESEIDYYVSGSYVRDKMLRIIDSSIVFVQLERMDEKDVAFYLAKRAKSKKRAKKIPRLTSTFVFVQLTRLTDSEIAEYMSGKIPCKESRQIQPAENCTNGCERNGETHHAKRKHDAEPPHDEFAIPGPSCKRQKIANEDAAGEEKAEITPQENMPIESENSQEELMDISPSVEISP